MLIRSVVKTNIYLHEGSDSGNLICIERVNRLLLEETILFKINTENYCNPKRFRVLHWIKWKFIKQTSASIIFSNLYAR